MIAVGQMYASTHKGDVARGIRQRRVVVWDGGSYVGLQTEDRGPVRRVRVRQTRHGPVIPGHRLVEEARCSPPS